MSKGTTVVELLIALGTLTILVGASFSFYNVYIDQAMISEGKMLISSLIESERNYSLEHNAYYCTDKYVANDKVLSIDASTNKYFRGFIVRSETPKSRPSYFNIIVDGSGAASQISLEYQSPHGGRLGTLITTVAGKVPISETW